MGRLILSITLAAALAALLAASPAKGQTPTSGGAQPPELAEVAPEPAAEAPEVASVVEETVVAAPQPAPAPAPSRPASDAGHAVSEVTGDVGTVAAPETGDQPVSGLVARTGEETSKTLQSTSETAAAAPLSEKIAKPVAQAVKGADRLNDEAQTRVLDLVASAEKTVLPVLPGQGPEDPAALAASPNQTFPLHQAPVGKNLLAGAWLGLLPEAGESVPATYTADTAAIDLLSVERSNGSIDLADAQLSMLLGPAGGAIPHFKAPVSPDAPGPPTGSTIGVTTSGSGASFFVPIAALLALLALASPAILRRLRELPDFPAPTPFVCALERPG